MTQPTPVLVVAGLDRTDQAVAGMNLGFDLPDAAVVQLTIDRDAGRVCWTVSDLTGIVEDAGQDVEHPCLSCAMREAILPTLARLADAGRWGSLVVVLPPAAEPLPMALGLTGTHLDDGRPVSDVLDLRSVITVVSCDDVCGGIVDDPLLAELDLALVADDRRAYGEVLSAQVEVADVIVLVSDEVDDCDRTLLDHLRRPASVVLQGLGSLSGATELERRFDVDAVRAFVDPRRRAATGAPDAEGVVTVDLASWRPFHPERLRQQLEALGSGPMRGRGAFWLPGRPTTAVAWEASGGQLSIGGIGDWSGVERATRLVVTTDEETAAIVREAFADALMTDAEMVGAAARWFGRPDGFEDWLGEERAADAA